ncbi:hypothetical protein VTK73DRAFT_10331 [Phialemonium thermophilum]|uniref:Uncharacterized protein n=1 Tax=Phialemonium thermophilum TaxID=223376 RepID=A0ABR3VXB5_9PEZI
MRWGSHWRCQELVMQRWDPHTGETRRVQWLCPFMPLFVSSKRMYLEALPSLMSRVTPIFTSSEDAWRFFVRRPPPALDQLRSLELSFCHPNDPLYLGSFSWTTAPKTGIQTTAPPVFGAELWRELLTAIRGRAPRLRVLHITLGRHISSAEKVLFNYFSSGESGWILPGALVIDLEAPRSRFVQDKSGTMTRTALPDNLSSSVVWDAPASSQSPYFVLSF